MRVVVPKRRDLLEGANQLSYLRGLLKHMNASALS